MRSLSLGTVREVQAGELAEVRAGSVVVRAGGAYGGGAGVTRLAATPGRRHDAHVSKTGRGSCQPRTAAF